MDNAAMNQAPQTNPVASGLASLGRGGDTMLVHMQPREVAGLQSLAMAHGGSLTVNPQTGLPEAGFLGDVLGAVAPIALGAFLGPAGAGIGGGLFDSALTAGLAVGAGAWALTGDPMQGLKWGLGAGGGATLGSNLAGYGATGDVLGKSTSLASDLATGAKAALQNPADYASYVSSIGKSPWTDAMTLGAPLLSSAMKPPEFNIPKDEPYMEYKGPYMPQQRQVSFPTAQQRQDLGTREWQYFTPVNPYPGFTPAGSYAEGGPIYENPDKGSDPAQDARESEEYGLGGLARFADGGSTAEKDYGFALPGAMTQPVSGGTTTTTGPTDIYSIPPVYIQKQIDAREKEIEKLMGRGGGGNAALNIMYPKLGAGRGLTRAQAEAKLGPAPTWNPPAPTQPTTTTPPPVSNPLFSGVGITSLPGQSAPPAGGMYGGSGVTTLPPLGSVPPTVNPGPYAGLDSITSNILAGNLGFAKGGYLHGPGDGMSDSIPATIEGKQPARLADGEFVIPADVVSHLGNGSTKAGAQRLYAMMDKVRKARTGTTKQGKQIKPEKYLPA